MLEARSAFRATSPLATARGDGVGTTEYTASPTLAAEQKVDEQKCEKFAADEPLPKRIISPAVMKEIKRLNEPAFRQLKTKVRYSAFDQLIARHYLRKPTPDDPEYEVYVESMPYLERMKYEEQFR